MRAFFNVFFLGKDWKRYLCNLWSVVQYLYLFISANNLWMIKFLKKGFCCTASKEYEYVCFSPSHSVTYPEKDTEIFALFLTYLLCFSFSPKNLFVCIWTLFQIFLETWFENCIENCSGLLRVLAEREVPCQRLCVYISLQICYMHDIYYIERERVCVLFTILVLFVSYYVFAPIIHLTDAGGTRSLVCYIGFIIIDKTSWTYSTFELIWQDEGLLISYPALLYVQEVVTHFMY